jgi:alcohol-forming fatty acyl-CoA reductase
MSETRVQRGRIAAVFDIDGTLLPAPSLELRLLAHLGLNGEIRIGAVGKWLRSLAVQLSRTSRGNSELSARPLLLDENKEYLAGVRISAAQNWIAREFADLEFFSEALAILDWHRRRGHAIVLISGTLAPLAHAVGTLLAGDSEIRVRATELESDGDRWNGHVSGDAICGPAKEKAQKRLAAEHNFDLSRSCAYADSVKDRWLLGAVGRPVAVNAGPRLVRHARRCGWRLENWNDRVCVPAIFKDAQRIGAENSRRIFAEKVSWK